jgi:hypothetical protein
VKGGSALPKKLRALRRSIMYLNRGISAMSDPVGLSRSGSFEQGARVCKHQSAGLKTNTLVPRKV